MNALVRQTEQGGQVHVFGRRGGDWLRRLAEKWTSPLRGFVFAALAVAVGCEDNQPAPAPAVQPQPVAQPAARPSPKPAPAETVAVPAASAPVVQPAQASPAPEVEMVREKAAVGMGEKGRGYGGEGFVATPIRSLWQTKERLALIQVEQALQLYKAGDGDGHGPKSHKEFMDKIIKANDIRLPELPQGHRYVYDPTKEELMVEQPK
jgi:hypothetical protein